ncbi:ABC transporter ATP-binding protein [Palleronia sp.]|uniref:ABC transporter ATP-binding protein n=1 Tax=Palleronia sp. TaxID=1940284 RepID=UPI0035C85C18
MADISLRHIRKAFGGTEILSGLDLSIDDKEFIVILGPSGCGKSTLLRLIAGLESVTEGQIEIGGRRVEGLEPRERGCAMVFQNYALYPHMTVAENIAYGLRVDGVRRTERRRRAAAVAAMVELTEHLDRKPAQLSGGQRQRVAMARAVIREPEVFLFDEPLSNLDAKLRVQMRHEIRRIHSRIGATSVFVTHDQVEGMTMADRLVVMNRGRIEQVGTPEDIYERPASIYVAGFIGAPPMNFVSGCIRSPREVEILGPKPSPVLATASAPCKAGRIVEIGLRPEHIRIGAVEKGVLPARFDFYEELGGSRLYHFSFMDRSIAVLSDRKVCLSAGEAVGLSVLPEAVHFFDDETGARLGSSQPRIEGSQDDRVGHLQNG